MSEFHDAMRVALIAAERSPDPSTQNGAVLVDRQGRVVWGTQACNEFPAGVRYLEERWERPAKYGWIEHAERNCLYAAARLGIATSGLTMVCPWAACSDCARGIAQAGIVRLVTLEPETSETNERWDASIAQAMTILDEASVEIMFTRDQFGDMGTLLRNGKPWTP
jgi:dCMP deaminase